MDEIDVTYLKKYSSLLSHPEIAKIKKKYLDGPNITEPIRGGIDQKTQKELFEKIDESNFSSVEKVKMILGLMMILDGMFPEKEVVSGLGSVLGNKFSDDIERHRKEERAYLENKLENLD
ncbi:MAG TPA: hypothetical protein VLE51_02480 [Candidatus Saccharimonadales bacterium]|nr:hypothetical protein [Candidatus Saccharimonadales bacterium]